MTDFDPMPGEKIIDYCRPSVLVTGKFWAGLVFIAISVFVFLNSYSNFFVFPGYSSTVGRFLFLLGIPQIPLISDLPGIATLLDVIGLLFVAYAELHSYFHRYFVTNLRVIERHGILVKDLNIIVPKTISDVSVDIGLLERMLGVGKVIIRPEEEGKSQIIFYGVPKPESFQNSMLKLVLKPEDIKEVSDNKAQ